MPNAVCNGVELYYERRGSGPKLLYCNGSGAALDSVHPLLHMMLACSTASAGNERRWRA